MKFYEVVGLVLEGCGAIVDQTEGERHRASEGKGEESGHRHSLRASPTYFVADLRVRLT
jgi:hypothetical protein